MNKQMIRERKKRVVSFTLPVDLVEAIRELAGKEKKSGSRIVEELIRESLKAKKVKELEQVAIDPEKLESLKGIISLGGNALEDSEAIYE